MSSLGTYLKSWDFATPGSPIIKTLMTPLSLLPFTSFFFTPPSICSKAWKFLWLKVQWLFRATDCAFTRMCIFFKLDLSKLCEFCIENAERRKMTAVNWVNKTKCTWRVGPGNRISRNSRNPTIPHYSQYVEGGEEDERGKGEDEKRWEMWKMVRNNEKHSETMRNGETERN